MNASFDSSTSFAFNQPIQPFSPRGMGFPSSLRDFPHLPNLGGNSPFGYSPMPSFAQFNQPAFNSPFANSSMSNESFNYYSQQMSNGPGGFNQSIASANGSSFDMQMPGRSTSYNHAESTSYFDQRQGGFSIPSAGWMGRDCSVPARSQWSDNGVHDNKSTIELGGYRLDLDKTNSSVVLTNEQNGTQTKIWGDPHIDLNAESANKTSGMFNGPLTFNLPDHTRINVGTQPASENSNLSYADNLTITQGNRSYVVGGLSEENSAPLTVQRGNNGFALAQQNSQDGMSLYASSTGTGWINGENLQTVTASDFHV